MRQSIKGPPPSYREQGVERPRTSSMIMRDRTWGDKAGKVICCASCQKGSVKKTGTLVKVSEDPDVYKHPGCM